MPQAPAASGLPPASAPGEQRWDPFLGDMVTYEEMCVAHADQRLTYAQLVRHWDSLELTPPGPGDQGMRAATDAELADDDIVCTSCRHVWSCCEWPDDYLVQQQRVRRRGHRRRAAAGPLHCVRLLPHRALVVGGT